MGAPTMYCIQTEHNILCSVFQSEMLRLPNKAMKSAGQEALYFFPVKYGQDGKEDVCFL